MLTLGECVVAQVLTDMPRYGFVGPADQSGTPVFVSQIGYGIFRHNVDGSRGHSSHC